jgi:WD40 repeat protein
MNSVAISGEGQVVIAGTYYRQNPVVPNEIGTYIYDADGKLLHQDTAAPETTAQGVPMNQGVYWVAVSRDGKWAASAGGDHKVPMASPPGTGKLIAYDIGARTQDTLLEAPIGGVNMVALSADGSYLVAGADAAYVFQRTGSTFAKRDVLRDGVGPADSVTVVAISDDGQWVVYGTSAGQIGVYSTATSFGHAVTWGAPSQHYAKSIAMAAKGSGFAAVTTNRANVLGKSPVECYAFFFNLEGFAKTHDATWKRVLAGCDGVMSVAVNDTASHVAAVANVPHTDGSVTGRVFFFDTRYDTEIWTKDTAHGPNSVSLDSLGSQIAVADGFAPPPASPQPAVAGAPLPPGSFYLFDAAGASLPVLVQPDVVSWTIQLSADGRAIAAGNDDAMVYYFPPAATPVYQEMRT